MVMKKIRRAHITRPRYWYWNMDGCVIDVLMYEDVAIRIDRIDANNVSKWQCLHSCDIELIEGVIVNSEVRIDPDYLLDKAKRDAAEEEEDLEKLGEEMAERSLLGE